MCSEGKKIGNITGIPSFIAGLLACIVVFIPVWLISPEGTTPQTSAFPYVLGAFVGMITGILVGTLVEFILKMMFENDDIARESIARYPQET